MNLKVVIDRVLVEVEDLLDKTSGGIFLPESRNERDRVGKVVAIGGQVDQVKVGDRVFYNVYSQLVDHDGKKYRLVKQENILAILDADVQILVPKKELTGHEQWSREKD